MVCHKKLKERRLSRCHARRAKVGYFSQTFFRLCRLLCLLFRLCLAVLFSVNTKFCYMSDIIRKPATF